MSLIVPISAAEYKFFAEYERRVFLARKSLLIPEITWQCLIALLHSDRCISEASLSVYIDTPRATIRRHLDFSIKCGLTERLPAGLRLSDKGRLAFHRLVSETLSIALGNRKGFSNEALNALQEVFSNSTEIIDLDLLRIIHFAPRIKHPASG